MVDGRPSIEVAAKATRDRRPVGSITGARADLSIRDAHLRTRRKSWNIEFIGAFEQTADGATLSGTIDIPDGRQLPPSCGSFASLLPHECRSVIYVARQLGEGRPEQDSNLRPTP